MADPGDRELYQELRLALVFNGGVSLAVWMGGVAKEIDRFRCAFHSERPELAPYRELLAAVRTEVMTDIVAGTSAGGINGALLAYVVGNGKSLECAGPDAIRDTWGELGALDRLLRQRKPRAALDSELLFRGCARVFAALRDAAPDLASEVSKRVRLTVTATDAYGYPVAIEEAAVRGRDHRLEMRFRRVDRPTRAESRLSDALVAAVRAVVGDASGDDGWPFPPDRTARRLDGDGAAALLARAARTTASFPIAFAPSTLPRDWTGPPVAGDPTGLTATPPMDDVLVSRGAPGALDTSAPPGSRSRYAIDGGLWDNSPFSAVVRAIDRTPADRDVARVVGYVVATDEPAPEGDDTREPELVASVADAVALPGDVSFVNDLAAMDADLKTQRLREDSVAGLLASGPPDVFALAAELFPLYRRRRIDEGGTAPAFDRLPPSDAPLADWHATADGWDWGSRPVRVAIREARRLLRLVLGAVAAGPDPDRDAVGRLIVARDELSQLARVLDDLASFLGDDEEAPAGRAVYGQTMHDLASALARLHETFAALAPLPGDAGEALAAATGISAGGPETVVKRALSVEVALHALTSDVRPHKVDYRLETIRPDHRWPFGGGDPPRPPLAGVSVHHFGGFLRAAWRRHDWMWGRLDGSRRMVDMLVGPRQIARICAAGDAGAVRALAERLAAVAAPDGGDRDVLAERYAAAIEAGRESADALEPLRADLRRRIHLAILAEELPGFLDANRGEGGAALTVDDVMRDPDAGLRRLAPGAGLAPPPSAWRMGLDTARAVRNVVAAIARPRPRRPRNARQ